MRDDFNDEIKNTLARRVGLKCSNPLCRKPTSGPQANPNKAINIGVAAHITAASLGGPRYDSQMSSEGRRSIQNGIWLCQNCAKMIDNDEQRFTVEILYQWKRVAEESALASIEGTSLIAGEQQVRNDFIHHLKRMKESALSLKKTGNATQFLSQLESIMDFLYVNQGSLRKHAIIFDLADSANAFVKLRDIIQADPENINSYLKDIERATAQFLDNVDQALEYFTVEIESTTLSQLQQGLLASYPGDREKAARQLGRLGLAASSAVPMLIKKLKDSSGPVRDAAAWALREIGTKPALDALARYENE